MIMNKELSIEQKAKRYDEAIEVAQRFYNNSVAITKKGLEDIFPELKESEDERIRKALIKLVKKAGEGYENVIDGVSIENAIAWLEKQGRLMKALQISNAKIGELIEENYYLKEQLEKQRKNNMGISEATKQELEDNLNKALEKETPESWNKFLDEQGSKESITCPVCSWEFEKQGEQKPIKEHNACEFCEDRCGCVSPCSMKLIEEEKPTDEIKPKFKVGDWVVYDHRTYQIIELPQGRLINASLSRNGKTEKVPLPYCEKWTIQDAKDGDVLCGYPKTDYPWIGIFHNLNTEGTFNSYCFLQAGQHGKFCPPSEENIFGKRNIDNHISEDIVPATKEQRNLLFQKMKESGYEWDAEKKELKKIEEKKDIHNKLTAFEFSLKHIIEEAIECGDIHNLKADADLLLKIAQKTSWSEEDIELLDNTIKFIEDRVAATSPSLRTYIPTLTGKEIPFLKALKDRVQLKQEWSEEDEKILNYLLWFYDTRFRWNDTCGDDIKFGDIVTFLKSIRHQSQWKPSDEQMDALHYVTNFDYGGHKATLVSLYEQLKKLKE